MSNQLFHNKWHGFNHYTVPIDGFPDSATDPIASYDFPFRGEFFNTLKGSFGRQVDSFTVFNGGSGYLVPPTITIISDKIIRQPKIVVNINTTTKRITSINVLDGGRFYPPFSYTITPMSGEFINFQPVLALSGSNFEPKTNSKQWWFYSSLTYTYSSDWQLFRTVENTTVNLSSNWNDGYRGWTTLYANSAKYVNVFTTTDKVSGEWNYTGQGGDGWHISLSSITWRTNVSAINIRQKVAVPVFIPEKNKTLTWYATAQTVYHNITSNFELTASDIFYAKKGGRYNMWLYVDRCPAENANVFFDPNQYNITVKIDDSTNIFTNKNVVALSAGHITRIDFTYDGQKMLGRATRYKINLFTDDDVYYKGTGITFKDPYSFISKNPVLINDLPGGVGKFFSTFTDPLPNRGFPMVFFDVRDTSTLNLLNTSIYVPGSGINFRYLNDRLVYFNYNLFGASWPSKPNVSAFPALTGSFDRVIGTLSGNGDWRLSAYADNLFASPNIEGSVHEKIKNAYPKPPYNNTNTSNIIPVELCASGYKVNFYSGKDKLIRYVSLNGLKVELKGMVYNGMVQTYNFLNENQGYLIFDRVQEDSLIEVYYGFQPGKFIPNNVLWFNSMDDTSLVYPSNLLYQWRSNDSLLEKLEQNNSLNRPTLSTFRALRGVLLEQNKFMSLNVPLTSLSGSSDIDAFTAVTVFRTTNTLPTSSVIWWLGDLNSNNVLSGYGLIASKNMLFTVGNFANVPSLKVSMLSANTTYVVVNRFSGAGRRTHRVFVNNRSTYFGTIGGRIYLNNYNLVVGKHPGENSGYGNGIQLYELYFFKGQMELGNILRINRFLIDKYGSYVEA